MRIDQEITKELDATGMPWRSEVGGRHVKLILNDRLVGILPKDGKSGKSRSKLNIISQIRRAARGLKP